MYDYLFQRNFPLYTALFGTVRLLILGIFHEVTTSVCITEKIPCPNPYPSEKYLYTDIRSMKQKQTKVLRHLEFVNFRVEIWEQGWGPVLESSILLLTSGDTSGDVSNLYYYSALYYY